MLGSIVGIDIGTSAIRAVHVRRASRSHPRVTRVGEISLPPGTLVNGELRNPDIVAEAIRRLWKKAHFQSRAVALGIGNQQTLVRRIDLLTDGDPSRLKAVLGEQMDGTLPVHVDELVLDGYPMGEFIAKTGEIRVDTFVVGALAAAAENMYATVRQAKLRPMRLDHAGFALVRAAVTTFGDPQKVPGEPADRVEHLCEVVVDIGAQAIIVAIHHGGRPALIRTITGGGESITRALVDHLGTTFTQAEYLKSVLGIAPVTPADMEAISARLVGMQLDPSLIQMAQQIINLMASSLLQGIRETVEFYLASDPYASGVLRVVLAGGGSQLPGLAHRLASELRTDVGPLTPLSTFASTSAKRSRWASLDPRFSLAFGLATEVK